MIGRVYRIIHLESEICYIGSTTNELRWRWQHHKYNYERWLKGKHSEIAIYPYFKEHGIEQFKMILVKEYDVVDRKHLEAFEQLWLSKFHKTCVNKNNPFRINKLSEKCRVRPDDHNAKQKKYYEANRESISAKKKAYREKNKEAIKAKKSERFECACGGSWNKGHGKPRHERSKKHQAWQAQQSK